MRLGSSASTALAGQCLKAESYLVNSSLLLRGWMLKHSLISPSTRRIGMSVCMLALLLSCSKPAQEQPQQGKGGRGGGGRQGMAQVISVAVAKAEIRDLPV